MLATTNHQNVAGVNSAIITNVSVALLRLIHIASELSIHIVGIRRLRTNQQTGGPTGTAKP
jgi:hypothetical protein